MLTCCNQNCEQGRKCPARRKLTERDLDRNQAAKVAASMSMPELLLATGAMAGPYRKMRAANLFGNILRRMHRALCAASKTVLRMVQRGIV